MRLQLHRGFTFDDVSRVVPYIARLGISHLYCSPILTARPGSMHGYDVVDPTRVNNELGGEPAFRRMSDTLRKAGLGLIVDIVPNHMAVGRDNPWWQDVLRHGEASRYAQFFDIDWHPNNKLLDGKVLLPVLGQQYGEVLDAGEITLNQGEGGWEIRYFESAFPVAPADGNEIAALGADAYNGAAPESRARLHRLLQRQHYRLAWWRVAGDEINWRRFFEINELAGMRVELPEVFEATHALLFRLYADGLIDGMRVDHVDGLADPGAYCRHLHARLAELAPARTPYVLVEKILGRRERLAEDWSIAGTTGYDFMDTISAVQHAGSVQPELERLWAELSGRPGVFEQEEIPARLEILDRSFTAQVEATADALHAVALQDPSTQDASRAALRRALIVLLAHFPVYRSYSNGGTICAGDEQAFAEAQAKACHAPGLADTSLIALIVQWLRDPNTPAKRIAALRFQQLSAPVAAKAVEDTAFYRYGRLLSRNDVGFDAARLGIEPAEFHELSADRGGHFPDAMLATATHDHKRGEDVRARLAVLSEIPQEWGVTLRRWMETNAPHRRMVDGVPAPSAGDEIMLYQMLLGAWPLMLGRHDRDGIAVFEERVAGWQEKALHEAKLRTSWTSPNKEYEAAARGFLGAILEGDFIDDLVGMSDRIGSAGAVNGLAQTLLKLTVPGVPDFYQGTELWDQSLVDPDNRRPVDFDRRRRGLEKSHGLSRLAASWRDGLVKQALIARVLDWRRRQPELFARGDYMPLKVSGPRASHAMGFVRRFADAALIVVVPRLPCALLEAGAGLLIPPAAWDGTMVHLPDSISGTFKDVLGESPDCRCDGLMRVGDLLRGFPIATLIRPAGE
jgi:malto-oligosyltrehalose synthase